MSKLEKEIKVLNVDIKEMYQKLESINAKFLGIKKQELYTYDIPTIKARYLEILELLNIDNKIIYNSTLSKLKILLNEFTDLISDDRLNTIYKEMNILDFNDLYNLDRINLKELLISSYNFNKEINNLLINPNKWIRLRKSNDKVELTIKHIFEKNNSNIEKVMEYEIKVNDFEETNKLLNNIGLVKRNYQEKIRHSFQYKNASIEIDEWPLINPYLEIECDDEDLIDELINLLKINKENIVSKNTTQVYKDNGIIIHDIEDLKFNN